MQRPDLSNIDPVIIAYIEYLEKKVGVRQPRVAVGAAEDGSMELSAERAAEALPAEHETTYNIITISRDGHAKRTLRHLYTRQHRGGMGVFGIDIDAPDTPVVLTGAEESQHLLLLTNRARAFRHPLSAIPQEPVFSKGASAFDRLPLEIDEKVIAALPVEARGYVALASEGGRVRVLRHHLFGEHMKPGTALYSYADFGPLASACWTPGDAELFVITRLGIGIRFSEKALNPQGDQGIKLGKDDKVVSVTPVFDESGVFIIGADGRGAIRQMSGFAANKSPGGSGKIAFKSNKVVGAVTVDVNDDIFAISRVGKIIRFPANEVPLTEGVVQGVNCMGLRADEVVSVIKSGPIY